MSVEYRLIFRNTQVSVKPGQNQFSRGLPRVKGNFIDLPALLKRRLDQPAILPLNVCKDAESIYYGDFLEGSAVGVVAG